MTRRDMATAGESPFLLEALERAGGSTATLEAPDQESPAFEWEARMEPAPTVDRQAAEPAFADALRKRMFPLLDDAALKGAVTFNTKQHPGVSEIQIIHLCDRLEVYVDRSLVLKEMGSSPSLTHLTSQMAHQFQRKCFRETRFHTGKLDEPTLDALGFVRHRGKKLNAADKKNAAATAILRRALTSALTEPLGTDVSAASWFSFMLDAPFLGLTTRGGTGLHLELMRRLRTAQRWLWQWARYRDLSPVELGDALLWDATDDPTPHGNDWTRPADPDAQLGDRHRGARPGTAGASMHLPGLAVDLAYRANPWVGSLSFKEVSGRAATLVGGSVIDASGARTRAAAAAGELSDAPGLGRRALHMLAQGARTTGDIYDALVQWNAWLERYLALGADDAALAAAIAARQADGTPGVLRPGGTAAQTQADWRRRIAQDLENLRKNSFSAAGTPRDPRKGFLSLHRDLVLALRDVACLAWGAVDIGPGEQGSGDMMHFDCRVEGIGRAYATATGRSAVPQRHPCIGGAVQAQGEVAPFEESEAPRKPTTVKPAPHLAGVKGKLWSLQTSKGSTTAIFVPDLVDKTKPLTALVWIHGDLICGDGWNAVTHVQSKTMRIVELLAASGQPFVLAAPSMGWSGNSTHALGRPAAMNAFLDEVCGSLVTAGWSSKPSISRLILAGHSRAYAVLDGLACAVDEPDSAMAPLSTLTDVWSLDSMYQQVSCASARWAVWAALKPKVRFQVFYLSGGPTAPESERLERKAKALGLLQKNLTITAVPWDPKKEKLGTAHCSMPSRQLAALLGSGKSPAKSGELFADEEASLPLEQHDTPQKTKTPAPPVVDPPGTTLYAKVPVRTGEQKSEVGIFIPDKFKAAAAIDLLVFVRGFLSPCKSTGPQMARFWNTGLPNPTGRAGHGPMALRETLNNSRKNAILVAPSLGSQSEADRLVEKGGFDRLVAEVLKTVQDKAGLATKPTSVRNIVLAAHSGGGWPMQQIVTRKDAEVAKVREVWGFDSMYEGPKPWLEWAKAEKDPKKRGFFHFFVKACNGGRTKPWRHNEQLEQLAKDAGLLGVNVHLADTGNLDHCAMLLPFLEKRLKATAFFDPI